MDKVFVASETPMDGEPTTMQTAKMEMAPINFINKRSTNLFYLILWAIKQKYHQFPLSEVRTTAELKKMIRAYPHYTQLWVVLFAELINFIHLTIAKNTANNDVAYNHLPALVQACMELMPFMTGLTLQYDLERVFKIAEVHFGKGARLGIDFGVVAPQTIISMTLFDKYAYAPSHTPLRFAAHFGNYQSTENVFENGAQQGKNRGKGTRNAPICRDFNANRRCRDNCTYRHVCGFCKKGRHSMADCRKREQTQGGYNNNGGQFPVKQEQHGGPPPHKRPRHNTWGYR